MHKCVACQYYDRSAADSEKGVRWGQCRRTGPVVHPSSAKTYMIEGIWPHVRDDDWCGEWVAGDRRADSAATAAMSALMQSGVSASRPVTPMFVAPEGSGETVQPPISMPLRSQAGSD